MSIGKAGGRLSGDDVARMSEQIAGLTAAGLPLAQGLRATSEELPPGRLRSALAEMARALEGGATLEEAVAAQGGRMPEHLRGIVLVGARTGRMSQVLGRFVAFSNVGADLRRRLIVSMAYPALSLVAASAVLTFVCSTLIRSFETIFRDFGVPLPKLTLLILAFSRLFAVGWRVYVEVAIGAAVFLVLAHVVMGSDARRALLSGIPVLGAVWKNTSMAEFCHLLSLLLGCEVPLPEALRLTGDGVCDTSARRACQQMTRQVEAGATLSQSIASQSYFPQALARILRWAESQESLPASLQMLGEMFEARARAQASFGGSVLGVITVIAILFFVAVVVIGLFLPLITLISKLSG
jgi:type II secretory pathway component PulF